jgi:predicted NAD/FAD-binding protein
MRIAIVGSGVSGLVAARRLHPEHDITVFEADGRIGGHVHTWQVEAGGRSWSVDTGFIVSNRRTYPEFFRLLAELGVPTQPSTMSFSVRSDAAGLEYNGSTFGQLFVQPRNLVRPGFLRMLADIVRFNREAPRQVSGGDGSVPLGELLERGRYSTAFRDWYLLPMGSAIWSIPFATVLEMPATFFVRFFDNHGMLTIDERPQWQVIPGGSQRYIQSLVEPFRTRIRLNRRVRQVRRYQDRVEVDGVPFDRVVFACHSDQALAILADPSPAERAILGALPFQPNDAILHTDRSLLPRRRRAWAAWNYRVGDDPAAPASVTDHLNQLQSLEAPEEFCLTLNGEDRIDPARIIGRVRYHHPIATIGGSTARARRSEISGVRRTHYCGAYWGNGFHEDGVVSALAVVREVATASRADPPVMTAVSG